MVVVKQQMRLPDGAIAEMRTVVTVEVVYDGQDLSGALSEKIGEIERRMAGALAAEMGTDVETLDLDLWGSAIDAAFGDP